MIFSSGLLSGVGLAEFCRFAFCRGDLGGGYFLVDIFDNAAVYLELDQKFLLVDEFGETR